MAGSSEPPDGGSRDLGFLDDARAVRSADQRRRGRIATGVSVAVTVVWFVGVTATGNWGRVVDNLVATVTMIFGSFVAGSTPQGGGAVAFPVFTKGLEVPAEVARTFSLCIQTIGMGAASAAIIIRGRTIDVRAILLSLPAALVGFGAGVLLLGDGDEPFLPSTLPGPYVKVSFTLLVAGMAFVVYLGSKRPLREVRTSVEPFGPRQIGVVVVAALLGGVASSLVGSGSDVFFYVALVVVLGLEPKIAVPSSVVVMAAVSIAGFLVLGLAGGQLDVTVVGDQVVAVGGDTLAEPIDASRADLFGLWLAAVPVVCWGAPLGSAFASRLTSRQLARFVVLLAAAEVLTTVVFLKELREDAGLAVFAVLGGTALIGALLLASRYRHVLVGVRVDLDRTVTRARLDVADDYRRGLGVPDDREPGDRDAGDEPDTPTPEATR